MGDSCVAGPSCGGVCQWFFLKPFLNPALLSPCLRVLAWPGFHGITSPTPTLLCINLILFSVCVFVPPPAVSLKWVTSVDSLTVLWILFSLWGFCGSKGLEFLVSKILLVDKWKRTGARGRWSLVSGPVLPVISHIHVVWITLIRLFIHVK